MPVDCRLSVSCTSKRFLPRVGPRVGSFPLLPVRKSVCWNAGEPPGIGALPCEGCGIGRSGSRRLSDRSRNGRAVRRATRRLCGWHARAAKPMYGATDCGLVQRSRGPAQLVVALPRRADMCTNLALRGDSPLLAGHQSHSTPPSYSPYLMSALVPVDRGSTARAASAGQRTVQRPLGDVAILVQSTGLQRLREPPVQGDAWVCGSPHLESESVGTGPRRSEPRVRDSRSSSPGTEYRAWPGPRRRRNHRALARCPVIQRPEWPPAHFLHAPRSTLPTRHAILLGWATPVPVLSTLTRSHG